MGAACRAVAQLSVINAIASLALRVATVGFIAGVTFLILLVLHLLGVPLHADPVVQVLAVASSTGWRLYRGSTPLEEIGQFLHFNGPRASVGLRSDNRRAWSSAPLAG